MILVILGTIEELCAGRDFPVCALGGVPQQGEGLQAEKIVQAKASMWRVQGVFGKGCQVPGRVRTEGIGGKALGWSFKKGE